MPINRDELEFFTRACAIYMAKVGKPNQVNVRELYDACKTLWSTLPDDFRLDADAVLGESAAPLKDRLKDEEDPIEVIATNVRAYGVIVRDYSGQSLFKFAHKSYYEFLVAEHASALVCSATSSGRAFISSVFPCDLDDLLPNPVAAGFCGEILHEFALSRTSSRVTLDTLYSFCVPKTPLGFFLPRLLLTRYMGMVLNGVARRYVIESKRRIKELRAAGHEMIGRDELKRTIEMRIRFINVMWIVLPLAIAVSIVTFLASRIFDSFDIIPFSASSVHVFPLFSSLSLGFVVILTLQVLLHDTLSFRNHSKYYRFITLARAIAHPWQIRQLLGKKLYRAIRILYS
jgi:hypothetical protein